ncbi:helix-turn-helix domain-containing protein [Pseudofrankia asymbiotica]|uniref:Transcriptional regulator n=1 Tax=Pseudofrankia asymbiotica TaxID=1834516 RepID=A0A1V2IJB7_9ACTN|nr:helix-turn-helix transcriptional regulator [Pseudofrankia asymbiotica]ONH33258.1 transcriptional regulator [Pseudofrankia asymbiotica]
MTEPGMEPVPDPASVSTEDELRVAMLALLGDSYDRAVERRTGLSKTTVNDLRNGRRRLTAKTLTLIVEAYDPRRRDAWLSAWRRVRSRPARPDRLSGAAADDDSPETELDSRLEDAGSDADAGLAAHADAASSMAAATEAGTSANAPRNPGATARSGRRADAATGGDAARPTRPERSWAVPWRMVSLAAGAALVASTIATLVTFFAVRGDDGVSTRSDVPTASARPGAPVDPRPPGGGGPGGGPGGQPPGGPGGAGPVGGPGPPRADMIPALDEAVPAPRGCYLLPLQTQADVVAQPDAEAAGIRPTEMRYTYYPSWHPSLAVGGRLSGPVPDGWRLVVAAWADPASTDSTAAHNPGNGRFYPGDELVPSDQNCFTVQPYSLGYGGYEGITTRVYAILVDEAKVLPFLRSAGQLSGLTEADLGRWGVRVLGYAVVPSRPE